jgi:hypothetical protein
MAGKLGINRGGWGNPIAQDCLRISSSSLVSLKVAQNLTKFYTWGIFAYWIVLNLGDILNIFSLS